MRDLDENVVVITGAGSGIGRALALAAARRGARLALCDIDVSGLHETADLVESSTGVRPRTDRLDVRDRTAVQQYAADVHDHFGVVHVVVNNAGIALHGNFTEISYQQFEEVIDSNFWGVVHGSKEFLPYLIESGDGHLVNISSVFGLFGVAGQTAYTSAKFAVRGFTEALRQEMLVARHPVQVTCVHPGGTSTAIARNARTAPSVDADALVDLFDNRLPKNSPERAAETILDGMLRARPRVVVGLDAKLLDLLVRITGSRYQRLVAEGAGRVVAFAVRRGRGSEVSARR